jgi:phospholipid-binding lipoprotein MlaA
MHNHSHGWIGFILAILALQLLPGCATGPNPADPWENSNRFFHKFNDDLDRALLKPAADCYVKVVPKPVRQCIGNGFDNLGYFDVILNDYLQGKWEQGISDSVRMAVNSTAGIGGIFDVAAYLQLPSHDNDFGVTLGKWKVGGGGPGAYLVLPLFGPSSIRDAPGIAVGILDNPLTWIDIPWYVSIPLDSLQAVDARARAERYFKFRTAAAVNDYVFIRDAYLQYRRHLILEGKAAVDQSIYDEDMDESATQPSSAPAAIRSTQPGNQLPPSTPKPAAPHP